MNGSISNYIMSERKLALVYFIILMSLFLNYVFKYLTITIIV